MSLKLGKTITEKIKTKKRYRNNAIFQEDKNLVILLLRSAQLVLIGKIAISKNRKSKSSIGRLNK